MSDQLNTVIQLGEKIHDRYRELAAVFEVTNGFSLPVTTSKDLSGSRIANDTGMTELDISDQKIAFAAFTESAAARGAKVTRLETDRPDGINVIVITPKSGGEEYRGVHIGG